jgi:hypothetical protein
MWGMDWIELAQTRHRWQALVNAVMNLRVPQNAGNFLTSCKSVSFSISTLLHGVSKFTSLHDIISLKYSNFHLHPSRAMMFNFY